MFKDIYFEVKENEFVKDLYLIKLKVKTIELFELVDLLQKDNRVEFVEPNFLRLIQPHTNDQFLNSQWSINNQGYLGGNVDADMDIDDVWNYTTGTGVKVAVIDEGVDLSHPDLTPNLLSGFDATGLGSNGAPNEANNDSHGTASAGIISAVGNNAIGIAGVAYDAKIIPVRVAYSISPTSTFWVTSDSWLSNGINWAWQNGADVLSNSWGGSYSITIENAINDAVNFGRNQDGCIVLFSSGNDIGGNGNPVFFPSYLPNVISVGVTSMCDERKNLSSCDGENCWSSNYGTTLDVVAPGVKIYTTDISGSAGYSINDYVSNYNGTSAACPNAAGVVALILSLDPSLTQQQTRTILETNTDKVGIYNYSNNINQPNGTWNNEVGYGRVNAYKAILSMLPPPNILGVSQICHNSSATYTLNNVSSQANVTWSVSPSNGLTLTPNGTSVTLTTNTSFTGVATLTANITDGNNTLVATKDIQIGTARPQKFDRQGNEILTYNFCALYWENISYSTPPGTLEWEWTIGFGNFSMQAGYANFVNVFSSQPTSGVIQVRRRDACGWSPYTLIVVNFNDCTGNGFRYSTSPNPTSSVINIAQKDNNNDNKSQTSAYNTKATLYDKQGNVIKTISPATGQFDVSSLPKGHYIILITHEGKTESHKIIVE